MTKTKITKTEGRKSYTFLIVQHENAEPVILVRRSDLRSDKFSMGNVTADQRAWVLGQLS